MELMEGKMERASNLGTIRTELYRIAGLAMCASACRRAANLCA